MTSSRPSVPRTTRREFIKSSTLAAGAVTGAMQLSQAVYASGDDTLRVGLIGCGGRGTGAASQALQADRRVKLTAMGDLFEDQLQLSLKSLKESRDVESKVDVPAERQFVGFDAYKQVLASGVDVVLLTTPPHFRPLHLQAAIEAGKHVFAEKPCAVDTPGVHSVLRSCEAARLKGLAVVSGLCLRSTLPTGKLSVGSKMAPSAMFVRSLPTTIVARSGSSRGNPTGPTCTGRLATGTTSPGCRVISMSNSTCTTWICVPGPWAINTQSRRSAWVAVRSGKVRSTAISTIIMVLFTNTQMELD